MIKRVFFSNYHISVNPCMVEDLVHCGYEVIMPDLSWDNTHLHFFAPNREHEVFSEVHLVNWDACLAIEEPMVIIIPCIQMLDDLKALYEARGKKDTLCYLTAQSNSVDVLPYDVDFVLSHDIYYHRKSKAQHKMLYFSRPNVIYEEPRDYRAAFESKQINLFINNFVNDIPGFDLERPQAEAFRKLWQEKTGSYVPFYGYGNPDGWPIPNDVQRLMATSMFTLVFKRRETWGQMVNESMLLGTPCIFLRSLLWSTFTDYEITVDTSILGDTVEELVDKILSLTYEEYRTLCMQSQTIAELFTSDEPRRKQLKWFLEQAPAFQE